MIDRPHKKELRVALTENDRDRLNLLAGALEMSASEIVRYYIRQAHAALGARVTTKGPAQSLLFPPVYPDGKTQITAPIPAAPKEPPTCDLQP